MKAGFNLGKDYGYSEKLVVEIAETFEIKDIEEMSKEVFGENNYKVEYTNDFKDEVMITVKSVTNEQKENLENKLEEKYTSLKIEEQIEGEETHTHEIIRVTHMPEVEVYDLIKAYIKPVAISLIASIIVFGIFFRKLGVLKGVILPLLLVILINGVYVSSIAITRIPVNEYVISLRSICICNEFNCYSNIYKK